MQRSLHLASQFVISCGTVTLDLKRAKVLLIRWRKTNEVFLPKGRKDVGESMHDAALRETFEETGHRAKLLPLATPTLAADRTSSEAAHQEPVAVSQRMSNGVLKIIFWYGASADSSVCDHDRASQEDEDFDTVWATIPEYAKFLSFEDDRRIARSVVCAATFQS